jgi:hypothetical protein
VPAIGRQFGWIVPEMKGSADLFPMFLFLDPKEKKKASSGRQQERSGLCGMYDLHRSSGQWGTLRRHQLHHTHCSELVPRVIAPHLLQSNLTPKKKKRSTGRPVVSGALSSTGGQLCRRTSQRHAQMSRAAKTQARSESEWSPSQRQRRHMSVAWYG